MANMRVGHFQTQKSMGGFSFASDDSANWRFLGACNEHDPTLWEAGPHGPAKIADLKFAQSVCRSCPVSRKCLQEASESDRFYTMRGGVMPEGQALSGKGRPSGARILRNGVCDKGHPILSEADVKDFKCRKCLSEAQRAYRKAGKERHGQMVQEGDFVPPEPPSRPVKTHCRHGHEYEAEGNGYSWQLRFRSDGSTAWSIKCLPCNRVSTAKSRGKIPA